MTYIQCFEAAVQNFFVKHIYSSTRNAHVVEPYSRPPITPTAQQKLFTMCWRFQLGWPSDSSVVGWGGILRKCNRMFERYYSYSLKTLKCVNIIAAMSVAWLLAHIVPGVHGYFTRCRFHHPPASSRQYPNHLFANSIVLYFHVLPITTGWFAWNRVKIRKWWNTIDNLSFICDFFRQNSWLISAIYKK